jgi:hypothetical protein
MYTYTCICTYTYTYPPHTHTNTPWTTHLCKPISTIYHPHTRQEARARGGKNRCEVLHVLQVRGGVRTRECEERHSYCILHAYIPLPVWDILLRISYYQAEILSEIIYYQAEIFYYR